MTVTAPPRPPQTPPPRRRDPVPHDPVERDDPESLIEEARQRAGRRRRMYAAAAAALALVGVSLAVVFGRPEPSQSAASEQPVQPSAAGAAARGQLAVWIFSDGMQEIYVVNADGSGLRLLTRYKPLYEGNDGGEWSPDGRSILTSTTIGSSEEVMVLAADGSGELVLTNDPGWDSADGWSPDGEKILIGKGSYSSNDADIYVMNADGSRERRLADGGWPLWSPDGRQIAYSDQRSNGISVMNADGSGKQQLTSTSPPAEIGRVRGRPTGRRSSSAAMSGWPRTETGRHESTSTS